MEFINNITIRARVAFYLAVAQKAFEGLSENDQGYLQADEALKQCWNWLEGKNISGDELCEYLENERDTGLMVYSSFVQGDPVKEPIWITIITALMYTIWQAYQIENEKYLPESIEQVDEGAIDILIEYAKKCANYDEHWIKLLENYLLEKYRTTNMNEVGIAILKDEIMGIR